MCKAVKRIKEKKDPSKEPTSDWNKSGGGWWNAEREAEYYEFQEEVKQIHPRLGRAGQDVGGEEVSAGERSGRASERSERKES